MKELLLIREIFGELVINLVAYTANNHRLK